MYDVKFVSYNGRYPNLCSGTLVLSLDGIPYIFPRYCLESGGSVTFDQHWNEDVSEGEWMITDWPEDWPEEAQQKAAQVNAGLSNNTNIRSPQ